MMGDGKFDGWRVFERCGAVGILGRRCAFFWGSGGGFLVLNSGVN